MKKIMEILQKIVTFYVFPDQTSFRHVDTIAIACPRWIERETQHGYEVQSIQGDARAVLPFQNGGQTRRKTISYWTQTKIRARYKKEVSTVFSLLVYHFMALLFLVNIPFLFNNLIYSQNPWDWEPCRETVRNDKKSWDSQQNRESWQVCLPN